MNSSPKIKFLSAPVQAASGEKTKRRYWSTQKELKIAQFSKNVPNVQLWNWFLVMNSYSTLQVCMKFAYTVTGLVFLLSYWISDNVMNDLLTSLHNHNSPSMDLFIADGDLESKLWKIANINHLLYNKYPLLFMSLGFSIKNACLILHY